jgi:hypothetical protein
MPNTGLWAWASAVVHSSALSNAKQRNAAAGFLCLLTAFPLVKKHATYDAVGQAGGERNICCGPGWLACLGPKLIPLHVDDS